MIDATNVSKIGIGTWGVGGFAEPDPNNNGEGDVQGITHFIDLGANYAEVPLFYARGRSAALFADGLRRSSRRREDMFLTLMVHHHREVSPDSIFEHFDSFCRQFDTHYVDSIQVSMGGLLSWGYETTARNINKLLMADRARYTSITNANSDMLTRFHDSFGARVFGHELHHNFEIRINQDEGVLDLATKMGIKNVVAQPLRRNRTASYSWPLLMELTGKYQATQNQIIIAWLVAKGMLPIPKSTSIDHINELWSAKDIHLDARDVHRLDVWRPLGYTPPKVDWERRATPESGVASDQHANIFDDEYRRRTE